MKLPTLAGKVWSYVSVGSALLCALVPASADIETDRRVGICTMYLVVRQNSGAQSALNLADNQDRALFYGKQWAEQVKQHQGNNARTESLIYDASSACRKIGIRPADFK